MAKKQNNMDASAIETRSLEEIEREVMALIELGYRTSQRIAVLVGQAKDRHFEAVPEWLAWCSERFCFARRTAFQLAKVGNFLSHACAGSAVAAQGIMGSARVVHSEGETVSTLPACVLPGMTDDPLLSCDLHRLEYLANLYEAKPDQCISLVKHWDPSQHSIAQVRDKVRAFLGEEVFTLSCGDCQEEFESDSRKDKLCPACAKKRKEKAEREKERRASCQFEKHLTALAELYHRPEDLEPHIAETGPGIAMAAAMVAADLAVTHVKRYHDWTRPEAVKWLKMVDDLQELMRGIVADSNE